MSNKKEQVKQRRAASIASRDISTEEVISLDTSKTIAYEQLSAFRDTPEGAALLGEEGTYRTNAITIRSEAAYKPALVPISADRALAVGVYLMPADRSSGKSIVATALAMMANSINTQANYIQVFEPRAPIYPTRQELGITQNAMSGGADSMALLQNMLNRERIFTDPVMLLDDLKAIARIQPTDAPGLICVDSLTDAMKAFAGKSEKYKSQPTFPGGSQPSDRGFLVALSDVAKTINCVIIGTLHKDQIPYADTLYGVTEGLIRISSLANIQISDRTKASSRKSIDFAIPPDFIQAALTVHDYGEYNSTAVTFGNRNVVGI
jgi:hypothetical protein